MIGSDGNSFVACVKRHGLSAHTYLSLGNIRSYQYDREPEKIRL